MYCCLFDLLITHDCTFFDIFLILIWYDKKSCQSGQQNSVKLCVSFCAYNLEEEVYCLNSAPSIQVWNGSLLAFFYKIDGQCTVGWQLKMKILTFKKIIFMSKRKEMLLVVRTRSRIKSFISTFQIRMRDFLMTKWELVWLKITYHYQETNNCNSRLFRFL